MRRRSLLVLVATVAAVAVVGCSSSGTGHPVAANGSPRPGSGASGTPSPSAGLPGSGSPAPGHGQSGSASPGAPGTGAPAATSPTPSPSWTAATAQQIPIEAHVTPTCVPLGTTARLDVQTVRKGAIGFVAVYAGEKSGAAPPFGYGYGGNDKGTADSQGRWTASWTVAPNTPPGPAYVLLVVGTKDGQRQVKVPFTVGRDAITCTA